MERASPIELRKAMDASSLLSQAGILFVPVPVVGAEDCAKLMAEAQSRLEILALAIEQEGGAV